MPYLDYEGVKYLWSKISMEDYPNNETLIAKYNFKFMYISVTLLFGER